MIEALISGIAIASVYGAMAAYKYWITRRFYGPIEEPLTLPTQLRNYPAAEAAYKIAGLLLIVGGIALPFVLAWVAGPPPHPIIQGAFIAFVPVLFGLCCLYVAASSRQQAVILDEDSITFVKSSGDKVSIPRGSIDRYWVGINGSLVLQLQGQAKRVLMPLTFQKIGLINKYLGQTTR